MSTANTQFFCEEMFTELQVAMGNALQAIEENKEMKEEILGGLIGYNFSHSIYYETQSRINDISRSPRSWRQARQVGSEAKKREIENITDLPLAEIHGWISEYRELNTDDAIDFYNRVMRQVCWIYKCRIEQIEGDIANWKERQAQAEENVEAQERENSP